jgi:hypothetical protein
LEERAGLPISDPTVRLYQDNYDTEDDGEEEGQSQTTTIPHVVPSVASVTTGVKRSSPEEPKKKKKKNPKVLIPHTSNKLFLKTFTLRRKSNWKKPILRILSNNLLHQITVATKRIPRLIMELIPDHQTNKLHQLSAITSSHLL